MGRASTVLLNGVRRGAKAAFRGTRRAGLFAGLALAVAVATAGSARAQDGRYVFVDQNAPVGRIGQWSAQIGKGLAGVLQSVRVELPSTGSVTIYTSGPQTGIRLAAPAQANVGVGFVYRLKISDLPDYPGVELYPSIEIFDCLHPPAGREQEFPIPIAISAEDIQSAVEGRMVTKVVYLEQPQLAVTGDLAQAVLNRIVPADRNLLIEADRVGRPMVLIRLGGRVPDESQPDSDFFVSTGPVQLDAPKAPPGAGLSPALDRATSFTPAEPRAETEIRISRELSNHRGVLGPTRPQPSMLLEPAMPPWEIYPDEYLLDGGDRGYPVHEIPGSRQGLESEDAVAEYADHTGDRHILPTNRVAIYSPRFGVVGTILGLESGITIDRLASTVDLRRGEGIRNRVATTDHAQRMPSQSVRVRSRASGFEAEERQSGFRQGVVLSENRDLAGSVEHVKNEVAPEMRQSDRARVARERQAALGWTRNEYPVAAASVAGAHQVFAKFVAGEMVGIEDRRTKGRLQIVKMADKQAALPGETVNFTIEFENLGDLELRDVHIIDNLTPRLGYVAQTATSDRPSAFSAADNGEGSSILTWILKEPLPGKAKGVVKFQASVR